MLCSLQQQHGEWPYALQSPRRWAFGMIGKIIFRIDQITKFDELLRFWFGSVHEGVVSRFKSARFYYDRRMCRREARTNSFGPENASTTHADASSASSIWKGGHRMQGRGRSGTSALGSRGSRRVGHSDAQKHAVFAAALVATGQAAACRSLLSLVHSCLTEWDGIRVRRTAHLLRYRSTQPRRQANQHT